jgi:hypothetical protein
VVPALHDIYSPLLLEFLLFPILNIEKYLEGFLEFSVYCQIYLLFDSCPYKDFMVPISDLSCEVILIS